MSSMSSTTTDDRRGIMGAAPLLLAAVVINLCVLGIAVLLGAALSVDNAGTVMGVGVIEVTAASLLPLALAIVAYALLTPRLPVLRRVWTPATIVLTILSLGALLGASDLTTAVALATMHLVVGGLAAFGIPARLGR